MPKQKKKVYSYNHKGEMLLVKAYSKKQIGEHFKVSQYELRNYCSLGTYREDVDIDLTGEDNATK